MVIQAALHKYHTNDGLIKMVDGDMNNCIQSVMQVFLEIPGLAHYFLVDKFDNLNMYKLIKPIF